MIMLFAAGAIPSDKFLTTPFDRIVRNPPPKGTFPGEGFDLLESFRLFLDENDGIMPGKELPGLVGKEGAPFLDDLLLDDVKYRLTKGLSGLILVRVLLLEVTGDTLAEGKLCARVV